MSTVLAAALVGGLTAPANADPTQVPDPGARPIPVGEVRLPDGRTAAFPEIQVPDLGPLAAEIAAKEMEIATAAEQLKALEQRLEPARAAVEPAQEEWDAAQEALLAAQAAAEELIGEAYRNAAALPPGVFLGTGIRDLSAHAPVPVEAPLGVEAALRSAVKAGEAEQLAAEALTAAIDAERALLEEHNAREAELAALEEELAQLRERNADQLAELEREREAADQRLAPDHLIDGEAHPDALAAVRFALAQLDKPYLFGAQGPDRYDCSGLMWDAYRSVGITLPRVASDQYWGTRSRPVPRDMLLPGDLIFYSSDPTDWRAIGHVGMYIGDGKMVHAPRHGDVVKVQAVWWSNFFGATRVVGAVEPGTSPSTDPPMNDDKPSEGGQPDTPRPSPDRPPRSPSPPPSPPPASPPTRIIIPVQPPQSPDTPTSPSPPPAFAPEDPPAEPGSPSPTPSPTPAQTPAASPTPGAPSPEPTPATSPT